MENNNLVDTNEYQEALNQLENHRQHTLYRKIIVTGHPRCGPGYSTAVLKSAGLKVGHELMEVDGISS